ncbi:hypothetical protein HDV05_000331 [Chytridiales sp. JEL 0842]|nr:hypothetical protein HDV05_000331 [Chytridiales sp. JEL 0842]
MPLIRSFRAFKDIPSEVYPLAFMMGCALAFGGYVATKKIAEDPDLRIRADRGFNPDHWKVRLEGGL